MYVTKVIRIEKKVYPFRVRGAKKVKGEGWVVPEHLVHRCMNCGGDAGTADSLDSAPIPCCHGCNRETSPEDEEQLDYIESGKMARDVAFTKAGM
jgi:hypothetical protein